MPFALIPPKAGRSPYWRVCGSEFGISIDRSTKTGDRRVAAKFLADWRAEAQRQALAGASGPRSPLLPRPHSPTCEPIAPHDS